VRECYDTPDYPAIGIAYVAGYLKTHGVDVSVIDGKLSRLSVERVIQKIVEFHPRVLGLTAMTHMITTAAKIAQAVRTACPDTVVLLGGFHGSFLPERTLREFPAFDYIIVGEGEMACLGFVRAVFAGEDPSGVQGVASRVPAGNGADDDIRLNGRGAIPENLDDLGMPAWEMFPKADMYPIMTQRGCPFACNFCSRPYGRRVRRRSPAHVVAELTRSVERFGCRRVDFYDETFTVRRGHVHAVCDAIIAAGLPEKLTFWAYVHANTIDLSIARKMKRAGFQEVGFGVESGNPDIMKQMRKGVRCEDILRAREVVREAGLKFSAYFIIGHPFETKCSVKDSINLAVRLNPDSVAFAVMTPYPGTRIWEMATRGEGGYKMLSMRWEDFNKQTGSALELKTLTRKQMELFQLKAYLTVYLRNFRLREMVRAIVGNRKRIAFILRKLLSRTKEASPSSWLEGTGRQPAPSG
jgi:radical SAM superfamily enzyme YgiQ (UPF0313 family)